MVRGELQVYSKFMLMVSCFLDVGLVARHFLL